MHSSAIRRKVSGFWSGMVEIAHNRHQQATAIENRLQKASVSFMLISILISVKPRRELPLFA